VQLTDETARADALAFADAMSSFWQRRLGGRLLGFYLLGSLAHGGFNRRYSDIDLGLVADGGLNEPDIEAMRAAALAHSPLLAPKLSLFWTDREFSVGRFPPLDRLDYLDHAVGLVERERVAPPRPAISEVRAYLCGAPFANWRSAVDRFSAMRRLGAEDHKPYLRAQLYAARFAYSWLTGRMVSNDDAVVFLRARRPDGLDVALLEKALKCRRDAENPDALFADRNKLPFQLAACERLITH
jgi:hypothetical protein